MKVKKKINVISLFLLLLLVAVTTSCAVFMAPNIQKGDFKVIAQYGLMGCTACSSASCGGCSTTSNGWKCQCTMAYTDGSYAFCTGVQDGSCTTSGSCTACSGGGSEGSTRCSSSSDSVETCQCTGSWSSSACSEGYSCSGGSCVVDVVVTPDNGCNKTPLDGLTSAGITCTFSSNYNGGGGNGCYATCDSGWYSGSCPSGYHETDASKARCSVRIGSDCDNIATCKQCAPNCIATCYAPYSGVTFCSGFDSMYPGSTYYDAGGECTSGNLCCGKACLDGYVMDGSTCRKIVVPNCVCTGMSSKCGSWTEYGDGSCTPSSCVGTAVVGDCQTCNSNNSVVTDSSSTASCTDDGNGCTNDVCSSGSCTHPAKNCDDGNSCTSDGCSGGSCYHNTMNCSDGDGCTDDGCSGGSCYHNTRSCSDGDSCTNDSCSGGSCYNTTINCDDGNSCTSDSCSGGSCLNPSTAAYASCTSGSCSAPYCGQSMGKLCVGGNSCGSTSCSGGCDAYCPATDTGAPTTPTIVYPIGSISAPAVKNLASAFVLSWSAYSDPKAESLSVGIWNASGVGTVLDGLSTSSTSINATSVLSTLSPDVIYHWQILAKNSTCGVENSAWSTPGYFVINEAPTYIPGDLIIETTSNLVIDPESGKNQICDPKFGNSRTVRFTVKGSDSRGVSDINDIKLRWNGTEFTRTSLVNGVAIFDVTFPDTLNNSGTYPLYVYMSDAYSNTGWVATERSLKVWDCKVPVSGSLYDGSFATFDIISCAAGSTDFTTKVKSSMLYTLDYTGVSIDGNRTMNVTHPDYSSNGNNLHWGAAYRPDFTKVDGVKPVMRYPGDNTCNTGLASFTVDNSAQMKVDPYAVSPTLAVDFSSFLIQLPWYQAAGGGVIAKNDIVDNIPNTCIAPCKSNVSMNGESALNGLVAAQDINTGSGSYGETNQWSVNRNVINSNYSYKYFYNEYFVKLGQGKAYNVGTSGINLSQIVADTGGTGVALVNGAVNVTTSNTVPVGSFFMLIASGDINVSQEVSNLQGIIITDKNFVSTGLSDSKLVIDGSVYSKSNVRLTRGFTTGTFNNRNPAVLVNYRPDFIFSMPGKLTKILSGWREGI